jgi:hypothetical protein
VHFGRDHGYWLLVAILLGLSPSREINIYYLLEEARQMRKSCAQKSGLQKRQLKQIK